MNLHNMASNFIPDRQFNDNQVNINNQVPGMSMSNQSSALDQMALNSIASDNMTLDKMDTGINIEHFIINENLSVDDRLKQIESDRNIFDTSRGYKNQNNENIFHVIRYFNR